MEAAAAEQREPTQQRRLPAPSQLLARARSNLAFRSKWAELNGAMGDLGTYIPIALALSLARDLNLGTTLVFTGLYNVATGVLYGVPMPVQPMKAISATAISTPSFGVPEIMAAGILSAGAVFLLGVTGLMGLAYRLIPLPVVRGIQLAQGLSFAMSAVKYVRNEQDFAKGKGVGHRHWLGLDGLLLAILAACFIVLVNGSGEKTEAGGAGGGESNGMVFLDGTPRAQPNKRRKALEVLLSIPSAVVVFVLGVALAVIRKPSAVKELRLGPSAIHVVRIPKQAWKDGLVKGALPQIPLSVLNSVVAVCKLSKDLFPEREEASATSVSITVGVMNLVGCWFGALPCCHGAGGLAGQYKFGGRSGGCVAVLGAAKLVLGLVMGSSVLKLLTQFPVGLLGVLLLFAGIELAMASRDMGSKAESFVMLVCTAVSLGSTAGLGFVCGIVLHVLLELRDTLARRYPNGSAPI